MKKIFSIVLATALLCGMLLPMAVSAADSVAISATGETTIQLEAYASSFAVSGGELQAGQSAGTFAKVLYKPQTSGTQCLFFETGKYTDGSVVQASIPVSVTEAGDYTLTITSTSAGSGSKLVVIVDGKTYNRTSTANSGNIYENSNYPSQDVLFEVPLTTSTEEITVQFGASSGNFYMMLDCMKLKMKTNDIKADGVTTIELEEYAKAFTVSGGALDPNNTQSNLFAAERSRSQTSNSKCLYFDSGAYTNPYQVLVQAPIPVSVTEAGTYTLTITSDLAASGQKLKVVVDGTTYEKTGATDRGNIFENTTFMGKDIFFEVPLTTSTKNITVQFGASSGYFRIFLDCMKLELETVDIATDGVTTIECEDYAKFFTVSGGALDPNNTQSNIFAAERSRSQASNSKCLFFDSGKYTNEYSVLAQASVPVSVTEAGTYILAITSDLTASGSKLKVVVDGTTYERTGATDRGNIFENTTYMGKDIFFEVPLTTSTKKITVQFGASSGYFRIFLDCIKLKKSAETAISKTTGDATVKYTAAEGPSEAGTAVLALYNDDILVSVEKWAVTPEVVLNEIVLSCTTAFEGEFDEAKVFVWKDFDKCLPLAVAKDLTVND